MDAILEKASWDDPPPISQENSELTKLLPETVGLVAVDTETTGLHPDPPEWGRVSVVSLAWRSAPNSPVQRYALPFAFGEKGEQMRLDLDGSVNLERKDWDDLLDWLGQQWLVFHGAKFDLMLLAAGTPQWDGRDLSSRLRWDTMLGSRDLDAQWSAELDDVERRMDYLDKATRKEWLASKKMRGKVNNMAWEQAAQYAGLDAEVTLVAAEQQMRRYDEGEGDRRGFLDHLALTRTLFAVEQRGIGFDYSRSLEIAREIAQEEARVRIALPFRATLPGAKKYFYVQLGETPSTQTDGGQPRLDDQEQARLVAAGVPHAAEFARLQKLVTARTKWFESYAEHTGVDGRLRTNFSIATVQTGRLSSTRVNLQALPHDYQLPEVAERWCGPRSLFRPRRGAKLWELDASQAELRVAAKEAKCRPMLELIETDADIHGDVTEQLFRDRPGTPTWFENRQIGKRADFSLIFGVGAETFQATLAKHTGIWRELHECNKIIHKWRNLYPEYGRAIMKYQESANHWKYVRLANGRISRMRNFDDFHKSFNRYVQGSLAEWMKAWLIAAEEAHPGVVVLTIHDSLVLETAKKSVVQAIADLGKQLAEDLFQVRWVIDWKEWHS